MSLFGPPMILLSVHDAIVAAMRADLKAERERYDLLLEKYQSLKMQGAVEVPKPVEPMPGNLPAGPVPPADELKALIHSRAPSLRVLSMMLAQLDADRASGVQDEDIRKAIESGVEGNGVPS
jgi:hypothetical protein